MNFNILTIFPNIIKNYSDESILGRAQKNNFIKIQTIDIRDFSNNKHNKVDDTIYGGGAGMLMKPEPIYEALKSIGAIPFAKTNGLNKIKKIFNGDIKKKKKTILLSPRGKKFDQKMAEKFSGLDELTMICGRYEGVDQRVVDNMIDEEISVGDFVLAGGELGALIIIEATSRLINGVLGNEESLLEESHNEIGKKEYPQYTKPENFLGLKVPEVLLSGDHKKIKEWRENNEK
ncbi:MAG: tRNA (guanosine(37)-N1)-methyltransferase TrmD [Patescibacteria group bacterium]